MQNTQKTCHIHFSGLVQGVGFRPLVYRKALEDDLKGWVLNAVDGVHIEVSGPNSNLIAFYNAILNDPPPRAIITEHRFEYIPQKSFETFQIIPSENSGKFDILVTPDLGICADCKIDLKQHGRRHNYPFTTCTQCGPRYSIIQSLPYDRPNTTMRPFQMCDLCLKEYNDPLDRRHFAQTNTCLRCAIPLKLIDKNGDLLTVNQANIITQCAKILERGKILAVKGIGGYLLMVDATNEEAINTLRSRKQRGNKPFALLYGHVQMVESDLWMNDDERTTLTSIEAPIVLLKMKERKGIGVCYEAVAPGMDSLGVMLPYAPILQLIADEVQRPLVATSGNISGSPIYFKDDEAVNELTKIADYLITNPREVLIPQDDSVIRLATKSGTRIFLRRSRGYAPNLLGHELMDYQADVLALGAHLKGSFGLQVNGRTYVSQYLGNLESFDAQLTYENTLAHFTELIKARPEHLIIDMHPDYFTTELGKKLASDWECNLIPVQHHKAHFLSVLAENHLLKSKKKVLGVIWDGTGYGTDGNIWGGEFFSYDKGRIDRIAHLNYLDNLFGDKMAQEPRMSALSMLSNHAAGLKKIKHLFSKREWDVYPKLLGAEDFIKTSSMGRLIDAVAALLGICRVNDFEAQAALLLEAAASRSDLVAEVDISYSISKSGDYSEMIYGILRDLEDGISIENIAFKFLVSLVYWIEVIAMQAGIQNIAFSGGVFQNAILVDLTYDILGKKFDLYFHKNLSPNDEGIPLGQIAQMYLNNHIKY